MKSSYGLVLIAAVAVSGLASTGCTGNTEASRQPTKSEVDDANKRRQAAVDDLNVPDSVKQQMKAHMGGPPAPMGGGPSPAGAGRRG